MKQVLLIGTNTEMSSMLSAEPFGLQKAARLPDVELS